MVYGTCITGTGTVLYRYSLTCLASYNPWHGLLRPFSCYPKHPHHYWYWDSVLQNNIAKGGSSASILAGMFCSSFLFLKRIGGYTSFPLPHTDEAFNPFLSLRTTAIFLHKRIVFTYGVKRASGGGLSCSDLRIVRRRKSPSS